VSAILEVTDVTKAYDEYKVVDSFSFQVDEGELRCLLGPNGAGKTTTMDLITGRQKVTAGKIMFQGRDITGLPEHRIVKHGIGRKFQVPAVFKDLTVRENLQVANTHNTNPFINMVTYRQRAGRERLNEIVELVGLQDRLDEVGGNLSHGDPLTDPGASFMALDAEVTLRSSRGERTLSMEDFFVDYYETALEPDEILTSVHVPPPARPAWSHIKFTPRSEEDFATVGVAVTMSGEGSRCDDVRIALNSVGPTIFRAHAAEDVLRGRDLSTARIEEAGAAAADASDPIEDVRGSSDYKRDLVAVFVRRAVEQAAAKLT
jgi:ABC-type transport system involved in cytochrome c biogenesis ATPase subunit